MESTAERVYVCAICGAGHRRRVQRAQEGTSQQIGMTMTFECSGVYSGISVADYGACAFSHWQDNGNTDRMRTFVGTGAVYIFTAVYNCGASMTTLKVVSYNLNSQPISGYYIVLYDQSGNMIATGFTLTQFSLTPGQTYSLRADSYGSCTFNDWFIPTTGGGFSTTTNPYTFTAASSYNDAFQAQYGCQ